MGVSAVRLLTFGDGVALHPSAHARRSLVFIESIGTHVARVYIADSGKRKFRHAPYEEPYYWNAYVLFTNSIYRFH